MDAGRSSRFYYIVLFPFFSYFLEGSAGGWLGYQAWFRLPGSKIGVTCSELSVQRSEEKIYYFVRACPSLVPSLVCLARAVILVSCSCAPWRLKLELRLYVLFRGSLYK